VKAFSFIFSTQGWESPVELNDDEDEILAMNELRDVGKRDWLGPHEGRMKSPRTGTRKYRSHSRSTSPMVLSRLFTVEQTGAAFWAHRGARRFRGAGGCGPRLIAGG